MNFDDKKGIIGIKVYTSFNYEQIVYLTFPFKCLKGYIKSIYDTFSSLILWVKNMIDEQNKEWKQEKINRNQDNIQILKEIKSILEKRFVDTCSIDSAISYLICKTTISSNMKNIESFRKKIIDCIPTLCGSVDNLDYEKMEKELSIIYSRPNKMHKMAYYQLKKIFLYLDKRSEKIDLESNECWGLVQTYEFSQEFAKKWVIIDTKTMEYDEIKLLVAVSCYLEKTEQEKYK